MDEKCFCHFNGYKVKDAEARNNATVLDRVINGIRRKVNAHSGAIRDLKKDGEAIYAYKDSRSCTIVEVDESYVDVRCSISNTGKRLRIYTGGESSNTYEVIRLSGYGITRTSVYSSQGTNKKLLGIWIDGAKHDSVDVLKNTDLKFEKLVIAYECDQGDFVINTTLTIDADGFEVYESIPESGFADNLVKNVTASSQYVSPIYSPTEKHSVFKVGSYLYVEKIEDLGNAVVKTFDFAGG